MLLVIDNYDSFTYNLVAVPGRAGAGGARRAQRRDHRRRDRRALQPSAHRHLARGRARPTRRASASTSIAPLRRRDSRSSASASATRRSARPSAARSCARAQVMHGKTSPIVHDGRASSRAAQPVRGHALPLAARRARESCPTASRSRPQTLGRRRSWAVRHKTLPVEGVQFHPESFLTAGGQGSAAQLPRAGRATHDAAEAGHRRGPRAAFGIKEAIARVVDRAISRPTRWRAWWARSWTAQATPAQIGGLLVALRMKGETRGRGGRRGAGHARRA